MTTKLNWIDVNIPWYTDKRSPEVEKLYDEADAAQKTLLLRAKKELPDVDIEAMFAYILLPDEPDSDMDVALERVERLTQDDYRRYNEWEERQLEGDMVTALQVKADEAWHAEQPQRSFSRHPMCRPGVVIQYRKPNDGLGESHRLLIGDICQNGGASDEFSELDPDDVVIRYAVAVEWPLTEE